MATQSVSSVYVHVIDDVISKVRDDLLSSGASESVLSELQGLWELKMMQCGGITGPIERSSAPKAAAVAGGPITPVHDLNVPYEGPEEYETPTADILFPPTPLQTPIRTPLPGNVDHPMYSSSPMGPNDFPSSVDARNGGDVKSGRPSPYMQPPSPWMTQRSPLGVDVNVAYVEGREEVDRGANQPTTQDFFSSGKRKRDDYASNFQGGHIPQQDGAGDITLEIFQPEGSQLKHISTSSSGVTANLDTVSLQNKRCASGIPQLDGTQDAYDDMFQSQGGSGEYNTPADHHAATPSVATPKPSRDDVPDDEEPPLNEDDDDDLDDLEQGEEEPNTHHLILAQFDKVTRTKSRWKCTLKDGIIHLNNKDILFNKATGEFDF
ncbi:hypothetical protein QJS10_CPA07g00133 [Acorus calamus]|uniref:Uncharacterized protein n=1 Tax=Acorus calamus TaxID=4465 RepID=A0AAV9EH88_ACOCL|nr:hypothetical protein QJS10_CPA07g00133 [Acorus calamus]